MVAWKRLESWIQIPPLEGMGLKFQADKQDVTCPTIIRVQWNRKGTWWYTHVKFTHTWAVQEQAAPRPRP